MYNSQFCLLYKTQRPVLHEKSLGLRMINVLPSFINMTEWHKRQVMCQQLIGDIKQILKIIVIAVTAFLRVGNHFKAHQFI